MSMVSSHKHTGLAPAFAAARARLGLIALLFALAAVAWWSTADRMRGMDDGPGTDLGALGWFLGVWLVMMAAMMFPSVAPTVALYARMARRHARAGPIVFAAGYLATWTAAGLLAYGVFGLGRALLGDALSWDGGGRWLAGGTLLAAAAYELTPFKDACLGKCRSPLGFLLGSWRDGLAGALSMGARHGAWCVGCCWALMASLFALGVMSLAWMAFVAALIALEKTLPWGRAVSYGTAALLFVLGVAVLVTPESVPGLTLPGGEAMPQMMGAALLPWALSGTYLEACNCEAICPCRRVGGQAGGRSTYGVCMGALSWAVRDGHAADIDLSGFGVVLVLRYEDDEPGSPWTYFLYVDERADDRQREALAKIFTGELGGTADTQFPWAFKPSRLLGWRPAPIEIEHRPRRGWFRVGETVTMRVREPVADQEPVTCVIPGHHRTGTEHYAELLHVDEGTLSFELSGKCAYQSTFEYSS